MRANAPFPLAFAAALLAFVALGVMPPPVHAIATGKADQKKHTAGHQPAHHANAHPEAQSSKREAEAKKRLAKDRKQQKKSEHKSKRRETRPAAARARKTRQPGTADSAARGDADGAAKANPAAKPVLAQVDPATETRVHAWVNSQQRSRLSAAEHAAETQSAASQTPKSPAAEAQSPQARPATDRPMATSADPVGAEAPPADAPAASDNPTGTSNPPPDNLRAAKSSGPASRLGPDAARPVSVVSVLRGTPGQRPQLPPIEDLVADPVILPTLYSKRGRLVVPPPMKGSHEILLRQNQVADDEGLDRIQNDDDLDRLNKAGLLIAIPSNAMLHVDERLPANRRYCRPWTALFLDTLARQHYARFQTTLQLTSAVRTVEFQQQLVRRNGNAAPAEGDTASPHLTGQAVDIGKKGLTVTEIAWLRGYLLPLVQQGKVDVEEEFQQSCFHISVYKKYLPRAGAGRRSIATAHPGSQDVLATGLP